MILPALKQLLFDADSSFLSIVEVKNGGAVPPLSETSSWHSV
jgi:hypothetical protein